MQRRSFLAALFTTPIIAALPKSKVIEPAVCGSFNRSKPTSMGGTASNVNIRYATKAEIDEAVVGTNTTRFLTPREISEEIKKLSDL